MNELEESNRQFIDAWSLYARRAANGLVEDHHGIAVAFCNVAMPLMNMVFLSSPVADAADLAKRLQRAEALGNASGRQWMFTVCEDWLPADLHAPALLATIGMVPSSTVTGMVTDQLAPPRRPAPSKLAIRAVDTERARRQLAELNTAAYQMPVAWGHEAMAHERLFGPDVWADVGYVADAPVSTSSTALLDNRLYVMMVASAATEMNKGYAEAVIRHSLARAVAATGLRRTVLHATQAGQPLYTSMGYRPTSRFTMYALGTGH